MKFEIQAENDDNFSIVDELQTDITSETVESETVESETVESETVESETVESETVENSPGNILNAPRPAPIENNSGAGWFSGTSWG